MYYQHPTKNIRARVARSDTKRREFLIKQGYVDVTPPRSEKQIAQFQKRRAQGNATRAVYTLKFLREELEFPLEECEILDQTITILRAKLKQLREGG